MTSIAGNETPPGVAPLETVTTEAPLAATWWVYMLACADGRTYIGVTLDVTARYRMHASGKGAKFTRSNPPLSILGAQPCPDKSTALRTEYALKQLDKPAKLQWAGQWPFP